MQLKVVTFRVLVLCLLTRCHSQLGDLNITEPLMLLVTSVLFLQ